MTFWKQLAASLVIILIAGGLWAWSFPGAPQTLERWGLGWVAAVISERADAPADVAGAGDIAQQQAVVVVASRVATATINDRLAAIGTGRAMNSVSVTPFASGRLTELLVEAGAQVEADDLIARLDSDGEAIALDRARISLKDAEARLGRIRALRASNTATAVQLDEAELAVSTAQLAVRDAELTLERRSIVAPITGTVGILPVSAGNYVTQQTAVATIDDRSRIVVDFWVPERFAGMIFAGQPVSASSVARPGDLFEGAVSAIDNHIDPQSRTLHVQARIANEGDVLRAGMSFQVSMNFPGDNYPAVDPLAIQWGTDGAFVWLIEDGKARRASVRIIQRNTDSVLVAGDFGEDGFVVTEGVHAVREGGDVHVVGAPEGRLPTTVTGS